MVWYCYITGILVLRHIVSAIPHFAFDTLAYKKNLEYTFTKMAKHNKTYWITLKIVQNLDWTDLKFVNVLLCECAVIYDA